MSRRKKSAQIARIYLKREHLDYFEELELVGDYCKRTNLNPATLRKRRQYARAKGERANEPISVLIGSQKFYILDGEGARVKAEDTDTEPLSKGLDISHTV